MKNQYDYGRFLERLRNANKEGQLFFLAFDAGRKGGGSGPVFSYLIKRPDGWKTDWDVLSGWVDFWSRVPVGKDGCPLYTLRWANVVCGHFGKQRLPTHVDVMRPLDGLLLLGLDKEKEIYDREHEKILADCPALSAWHTKYFHRIQKEMMYPACLSIAGAFLEGKGESRYKREIAASGVDTKFIERHGFLIRTLWNALFPDSPAQSIDDLAAALFWKEETVGNVYVRFLDPAYSFYGTRQCFMSADDLASFQPPVTRVFVVENKVNGFTFPGVPKSLILAGAGYGILEAARQSKWLQEAQVYYWGDMDSDGFYILSKLREILPQTRSFLMDWETAEGAMDQAVPDEGRQDAVPRYLTVSEKMTWKRLKEEGLRIEQERIPQILVRRVAACLVQGEENE